MVLRSHCAFLYFRQAAILAPSPLYGSRSLEYHVGMTRRRGMVRCGPCLPRRAAPLPLWWVAYLQNVYWFIHSVLRLAANLLSTLKLLATSCCTSDKHFMLPSHRAASLRNSTRHRLLRCAHCPAVSRSARKRETHSPVTLRLLFWGVAGILHMPASIGGYTARRWPPGNFNFRYGCTTHAAPYHATLPTRARAPPPACQLSSSVCRHPATRVGWATAIVSHFLLLATFAEGAYCLRARYLLRTGLAGVYLNARVAVPRALIWLLPVVGMPGSCDRGDGARDRSRLFAFPSTSATPTVCICACNAIYYRPS